MTYRIVVGQLRTVDSTCDDRRLVCYTTRQPLYTARFRRAGSSATTDRLLGYTGVHKGAQGAQPPARNGRAKKKGRGYFYQMSNMYTCIAYLIEIRKFCSKNLVHKGVNFEAQNAL